MSFEFVAPTCTTIQYKYADALARVMASEILLAQTRPSPAPLLV
jgi:hypothetical protein